MANYTLNVLRDHTVYPNREAAIEALNLFEHHSYGQPLTILYKDDANSTRVMFVVGIKNAEDETTIKHGPDFYEIINDFSSIKGEVDWKAYLQGSIVDTDEPLNVVSLSATDFAYILEHWDERYTAFNDYVFFVQDRDKGLLYKGNVPYGGEGGGYILPIAGSDTLGGIKVGSNLTIEEDGTLNAVGGGGSVEGIYISGSTMTIGDSDINDIVVGGAGDSTGTIILSGNDISIGTSGTGSVEIGTSGRLIDLKGSNVYIDGSNSVSIDSTDSGIINIGTGSGSGIIDIGGSRNRPIYIGTGSGLTYIGGSNLVNLAGSAITITGGCNIYIGKTGVANHITLRGSLLSAYMLGSIDLSGSNINLSGSNINMYLNSGSMNITGANNILMSGSSASINGSSISLFGGSIKLTGSFINLTGSFINLTGDSYLSLYGGSTHCNMRITDGGVDIHGLSGAYLFLSGNTSLEGSTINIGSYSSGSINIGGPYSSGSINIGGSSSGSINIGGSYSSGSINIGGPYSSGSINIGGSNHSGNINMGGLNSNVNISGRDINMGGSETTGSINIGGSYFSGSINIGGSTHSGYINIGGLGSINIGGSYSSGSINIGGSYSSGSINIGGSNHSGYINIGGPGSINIGGSFSYNPITIGGPYASSPINIGGSYSSGSINIGGSTHSGYINIGGSVVEEVKIDSHYGSINIGGSSMIGSINIGGSSMIGSINIGSQSSGYINIGNTSAQTYLTGSNINLNSDNVYLKGVGGYSGGTPGSTDVRMQDAFVKISRLTQAEYNALVQGGTIDDGTLYVITDAV